MTTVQDHPVKVEDIESGLSVLNKRQRKLKMMSIGVATLFVISVVTLFVQQDFIYSFFGLTQQVEQLHLPVDVDVIVAEFETQPDYLVNLLSWFGWLLLKIFVSFIGAFVVVSLMKKFHFFYVRFKSFILKFVAWLIALIVIWSGLTYVQYDLRRDHEEQQYELVHYDQHIQQSEIAQLLNQSEVNNTVKDYVLAQTALLHRPVDRDVATSYVARLIQAERSNPNFIEYGFKPEQLWAMQHQLYGKSVSPMAKNVEPKVLQANRVSSIVQWIIIVIAGLTFVLSLFCYLISVRIKRRALRIEQNIHT